MFKEKSYTTIAFSNTVYPCRILHFHDTDCDDYCLMECDALQADRNSSKFRRNMPPLFMTVGSSETPEKNLED
jgi:hypothetical protein